MFSYVFFLSSFNSIHVCVEWQGFHVHGNAGERGRCSPARHHSGTRDGSRFIGTLCKSRNVRSFKFTTAPSCHWLWSPSRLWESSYFNIQRQRPRRNLKGWPWKPTHTHKHNSSGFDAEHVGRLFSSEKMYSASEPELQFGLLDSYFFFPPSKLKLEVIQSPSHAAIKYACEPSHKHVAYKLSAPDHLLSADPPFLTA